MEANNTYICYCHLLYFRYPRLVVYNRDAIRGYLEERNMK